MRGLRGVALVGTLAGAVPAAGQDPLLTLDQAQALALQGSRTIRVAALQVERSEQQLAAARTRRFPVFNLEANASQLLTPIEFRIAQGEFGTYPSTGPIPDRDTLITTENKPTAYVTGLVAQPLTRLYQAGLNIRLAELGREIDRERLRAERISVLADVKRTYRTLVQTAASLEAARESVRVHREMDRTVDEYVRVQTALAGDGLATRARLASEELKALQLEHALATQKEQMNDLLGRELTTTFSVEALPEPAAFELDLQTARTRALAHRSEVRQARLRAEQADYDRRLQKAGSIPEVNLAFSYYSFFNMEFLPRNVASLGLQLKWEPFDWGRKRRETAEKTQAAEQARTAARQAEASVQIEVGAQFRRLEEARAQVRVAALGRDSARESARVARVRHAAQVILLREALAAQAEVAEADAAYQQALQAYWTARTEMEKAIGEEGAGP